MSKEEKTLDITAYQKADMLKDIAKNSPDVKLYVRVGNIEFEIKDRVQFAALIDSEQWILCKKSGWVSVDR